MNSLTDKHGTPYIDKPLLSPGRILMAIRLWAWLMMHNKRQYPFWQFVIYHRRPYASYKAGRY